MIDINRYADEYSNAPFEDTRVEIRRNYVIKSISKYPHSSILEVGCGLSPLFLHFHDFEEWVVIEPVDRFYKNAKSLAGENVRCIHGFAEDSVNQLSGVHFDWILISSLLHEVEKPAKLLDAVKSICKRDTMVHINVPNANSFHRLIGKEMGVIQNEYSFSESNIKMQHHSVFSMDTLCKLLLDSGFDIVDATTDFIKPFSHIQMQQCLDAGTINQKYLDALSGMGKYIPDLGSEIYINCKLGV